MPNPSFSRATAVYDARSAAYPSRAVPLVRAWLRTHHLDAAKLARRLDRSYAHVQRLLVGASRPDPGVMYTLRRIARIPLDAWMVPAEVTAAKASTKDAKEVAA